MVVVFTKVWLEEKAAKRMTTKRFQNGCNPGPISEAHCGWLVLQRLSAFFPEMLRMVEKRIPLQTSVQDEDGRKMEQCWRVAVL